MSSDFSDEGGDVSEGSKEKPYFVTNFSSRVLVGNWYEERIGSAIDPKAITPGIYGQSGCINETSVTKSDFHQFSEEERAHAKNEFIVSRENAFSNHLNGLQTNLKLWDNDDFAKNNTTMTDIMFRIIPKQTKPIPYKCILKGRPRVDTLKSFGNQTWTGDVSRLRHNQWIDENMPNDLSMYKLKFRKHVIVPEPGKGAFKRLKTQFKNTRN